MRTFLQTRCKEGERKRERKTHQVIKALALPWKLKEWPFALLSLPLPLSPSSCWADCCLAFSSHLSISLPLPGSLPTAHCACDYPTVGNCGSGSLAVISLQLPPDRRAGVGRGYTFQMLVYVLQWGLIMRRKKKGCMCFRAHCVDLFSVRRGGLACARVMRAVSSISCALEKGSETEKRFYLGSLFPFDLISKVVKSRTTSPCDSFSHLWTSASRTTPVGPKIFRGRAPDSLLPKWNLKFIYWSKFGVSETVGSGSASVLK